MIKEDSTSLKVIVFAESVCKNNAFLLVIISIWIPFHALKRSNLTFKVEVNQETCFIANLINLISEAPAFVRYLKNKVKCLLLKFSYSEKATEI